MAPVDTLLFMPRTARASVGGMCYHVLNRGNRRAEVFHKDGDYQAFVKAKREKGSGFFLTCVVWIVTMSAWHPAHAILLPGLSTTS
jgi:hypothetical protein